MTRTHELEQDRTHDDHGKAEPLRAPGRSTLTQHLVGPNGPMVSGLIRRKARDGNGVENGAEHAVAAASSSTGRALPDDLRSKFEGSLGSDLSSVRIHDGQASASSASAVGARAYTLGNDIHFGAGQYDPSSASGEHLIAHEVAHTVQQSGGVARRVQYKLEVSAPGDAHEIDADRAADAMVRGASASVAGALGLARRIMREKEGGESGKKEGGGGAHKDSLTRTFDFPLGEKHFKYFTISGTLSAEFAGTLETPAQKGEGGDFKVGGKDSKGKKETEVEKEIPIAKWESEAGEKVKGDLKTSWTDGFDVTETELVGVANGGVEGEEKAMNLSATLKVKFKNGLSAEVGFAIVKYKGKAGTKAEHQFGELSVKLLTPEHVLEKLDLGSGASVSGTVKGSGMLSATPNWTSILEWVAEKGLDDAAECLAESLASGAAAGGAIAAVVMIAIGAEIDISEGNDIGSMTSEAYNGINDYATCYGAAMRNTAAGKAGKYGGQGFAQGQLDRNRLLRKYSEDEIAKHADEATGNVVTTARVRFRAEAEARFRSNHAIMTKVRDGELPSDFTAALDGSLKNTGASGTGTVAQDDQGRNKTQEMEIIRGALEIAIGRANDWGSGKVLMLDPTSTIVGAHLGQNLRIERVGYFDDWRPNPAQYVGAQASKAFDINGADAHISEWSGTEAHQAPTEAQKASAKNALAEQLIQQQAIVGLFRRAPMPDDNEESKQGARNVEEAHDRVTQNSIDGMVD